MMSENNGKGNTVVEIGDHIYVVCEGAVDKGDWFLEFPNIHGTRTSYHNKPYYCDIGKTGGFILTKDINFPFPECCKKIIQTTDQSLKTKECGWTRWGCVYKYDNGLCAGHHLKEAAPCGHLKSLPMPSKDILKKLVENE